MAEYEDVTILEHVESRQLATIDALPIDIGDTNGDGEAESITAFYRYRLDQGDFLYDDEGRPQLALQAIGGRDYWVQDVSDGSRHQLDGNGNRVLERSETRAQIVTIVSAVEQVFGRGLTEVFQPGGLGADQGIWQSFVRWELKPGGEYLYNADGSPILVVPPPSNTIGL